MSTAQSPSFLHGTSTRMAFVDCNSSGLEHPDNRPAMGQTTHGALRAPDQPTRSVPVTSHSSDQSADMARAHSATDQADLNVAFMRLVRTRFLDEHGRPDRSKCQEPLNGEVLANYSFRDMWLVVKEIPGLVVLRRTGKEFAVGWEDSLREEILDAMAKRQPLYHNLWNQHAVMLNCEPKHFLRKHLGLNLNLNGLPFPPINRDLAYVLLNKRRLFDFSILDDMRERDSKLIIKIERGIAVVGWNACTVDGQIGRLMYGETRYTDDIDRDSEARHLAKYWTDKAAIFKSAGDNNSTWQYHWACHHALRERVNQAPGPPLKFDFASLPGSYLVKIVWTNLKPEFQSKAAVTAFGQPVMAEMKLHILPKKADDKPTEFRAHFNFGLIEGTMRLSCSQPREKKPEEPHIAVTSMKDSSPSVTETPRTTAPRGQKRRRTDSPARSLPEPKTYRKKHRRIPLLVEPPAPVYDKQDVPHKVYLVQFNMLCRIASPPNSTAGIQHYHRPGGPSHTPPRDIVTYMSNDCYGHFAYHEGTPGQYLGSKGEFYCPAIAEGPQRIVIYRISEGAPLSEFGLDGK